MEGLDDLEPNHAVPVVDVHLNALELTGQEKAIVRNEVSRAFKFIKPLLKPVLRCDQIREVIPIGNDDVG